MLEPLNTRIDHPGYFLQDMATAVALVKEIAHPRLKVLCDLYHLAVMGEDLEGIIDRHVDSIGHFHVADVPGRHEPGTGTLDWPALLRRIRERGYDGTIGFEYAPLADSAASLDSIRKLWDAGDGCRGLRRLAEARAGLRVAWPRSLSPSLAAPPPAHRGLDSPAGSRIFCGRIKLGGGPNASFSGDR